MLLPSNDSEECTDALVLIVQLVTSCIRYVFLNYCCYIFKFFIL